VQGNHKTVYEVSLNIVMETPKGAYTEEVYIMESSIPAMERFVLCNECMEKCMGK